MKSLLLALSLLLVANSTVAASEDYTAARFAELAAAHKPVLVDVYAPWCPTCRRQKAILGELFKDPKLAAINVLIVDYDNQPDVVAQFKAPRQSTLVMFNGGVETGRLIADTREAEIRKLLESGLVDH